ncbi:MAG TPA: hypothetical protein PLB89_17660 [Flavobacteriales bacterium]|nr:hypothetical protein [Flavobacteriales bacterium]
MGRPYTGAATVYSSPRLELSRLLKVGYFTKDAEVSGSWTWTNGDAVRIFTKRKGAEVYMELRYTWTHPHTGVAEDVRQRFDMVSKPSNLGQGEVLYFRCPSTGRPCRILYRAYHARTFRSRWGFSYRLYYPSQTCGKLNRWDETYWNAERHLERSKGKRNPGTYRGKPTKRLKRRERLLEQLSQADEIRWSPACWPIRLRGAFTKLP